MKYRIDLRNELTVITVLALVSSLAGCSSAPTPSTGEVGGEITFRYSLEEGDVLKYEGYGNREMQFQGMSMETIHSDRISITYDHETDDGNLLVDLKYLESSDKMVRLDGYEEIDAPVKPEGRTISVTLSPKGEVLNAGGFIVGISGKNGIKNYVDKWFFELPEDPVKVGDTWEREIDEEDERGKITGLARLELKKIEYKDGIEVAVIDVDYEGQIISETPSGKMTGTNEGESTFKIAVKGGYIVESSGSSDFKGAIVSEDASGGEQKQKITVVNDDKVKLCK